jgi:CRP-like cAMP-binding protein
MSLWNLSPLQTFVEKLALRSSLNNEEKQAVLDLPGKIYQIQANRDFGRLGARVGHACLVIDGLVARFGQNQDGDRQITALHVSGDMIDLHSIVAPEAISPLQALTVTTVLFVPHAALRDVAQRYPAIAEAFWRECVLDAAVLAKWIVNIGRRNARARTAHLFCEIASRYDAVNGGGPISFSFAATQTQLGEILALTSVHVNRTLKSLRDDNVLDVRQRRVTIIDWDRARQIADFDPAYLHIGKSAHEASQARAA